MNAEKLYRISEICEKEEKPVEKYVCTANGEGDYDDSCWLDIGRKDLCWIDENPGRKEDCPYWEIPI